MVDRKLLLIGLPEAGKSTFIAALWHVLDAGRVEGSLRLAEVHGDQRYLNEIRDAWGSCKPLERNRRGQGKVVPMRLKAPEGDGIVELVLPDPSGESFSDQWEFGRCPAEYVDLAREASGVLLFVNPEKVNEGLSISQVVEAAGAAGGEPVTMQAGATPHPWTPASAGTQVQLVELLQVLLRPPFERRRLPVAVVVSAWDRLLDLEARAEEWVGKVLPLLLQFLRTNEDSYPSRIYGVSAQGGDLMTDRDRLRAEMEPWKRVIVVGPGSEPHDISAPVRWLLAAARGAE